MLEMVIRTLNESLRRYAPFHLNEAHIMHVHTQRGEIPAGKESKSVMLLNKQLKN